MPFDGKTVSRHLSGSMPLTSRAWRALFVALPIVACLLVGAAHAEASPRTEARALTRQALRTTGELQRFEALVGHRERIAQRSVGRCRLGFSDFPPSKAGGVGAAIYSLRSHAVLDPLLPTLRRFASRLNALRLTDTRLRVGRDRWLRAIAELGAIPRLRGSLCAALTTWKRHGYSSRFAPFTRSDEHRVSVAFSAGFAFSDRLEPAIRRLRRLGVPPDQAAAFTPDGLLAAALSDTTALSLGYPAAGLLCDPGYESSAHPRFVPGRPPRALYESVGVLRRAEGSGDQLPTREFQDDDFTSVYRDHLRQLFRSAGGRRFFLLAGRPHVQLLPRRCLRRLSAAQQRRGRQNNRERRARARGSRLCLELLEPDGLTGACSDVKPHHRLGTYVLLPQSFGAHRSELAGVVPDRVATVTADYGHVRRTAKVKGNFFRIGARRWNPYPDRGLMARDRQGHVVRMQRFASAIYVTMGSFISSARATTFR